MAESTCNIRALIFDMGGVLLRTESQEPRQRLAARFGLSLDQLYQLVFDSEEAREEQLGVLPSGARWAALAQRLGLDRAGLVEFQREMFAGDQLDEELVRYIRQMRGRYKTALLSNAYAGLDRLLRERWQIDDCFDVIVISALVGMMKPDPAIFRYTLDRLQVAPQEAVFLDDSAENVAGAAALGIHAILFTTRDAVFAELEALLQ